MKRCTAACTGRLQGNGLGVGAQPRRWISYDKERLTQEALRRQVESGFQDTEGQTVKVNYDDKTVSTAAGSLPISPVMDPDWMKARRRQRKADPGKKTGQFRRKLSNNPFAEALITPFRRCLNTNTCLPRYFFQDFEVVKHPDPEATKSWWAPGPLSFESVIPYHEKGPLPFQMAEATNASSSTETINASSSTETTNASSSTETTNASFSTAQKATAEIGTVATTDETAAISTETSPDSPQQSTNTEYRPRRAPFTSYVLSRQSLVDLVGGPRTKLLSTMVAVRHGMAANLQVKQTIWRPDMGDLLLESLRRRAVDALIIRAKQSSAPKRKFLEPCSSWDDVKKVDRGGCVLWIPETSAGVANRYATLDVEGANYGKKMAVHDLRWLLGDEEVQRLREETELFQGQEFLVLKYWNSKSARSLHLLLWRLQGYLKESKTRVSDPGRDLTGPESPTTMP